MSQVDEIRLAAPTLWYVQPLLFEIGLARACGPDTVIHRSRQ